MSERGEPVMHNNHHVFFERKNYKSPIERRVRNMGAFVLKVNGVDHQELHANVPPPPMLQSEQLHDLHQFMQEHNYDIEGLDGLAWGIVWANDRRLYNLEENLDQQYHYLSGDYRR